VGCLFAILVTFGAALLFSLIVLLLDGLGLLRSGDEALGWALPAGVAALVFTTAIIFLAGRSLRRLSTPLDDMLAASGRVAEGDYSTRVEEQGPSEIRSLARGFNSMAARLEASDQQRRDMLADVSHELRTPLTVIQGNVEGMLDGLYPADEKILRSILEETHLLSRLVDDLRTLSLAESGAIQLKREPTDLGVLISETVASFRPKAEAAGIVLVVQLGKSLPMEVDPNRIREILTNLISNALRYTPEGGMIHIGFEDSTISVEDDGSGIPAAELPHVFERYYKSSDSGGMGLGLSIAKYLVEAHGGEINAASSPGGGTRISFTLPG
jgi:two-component system OmpR family sensor kinase/two-component system sensor histidine kinase BaeS